MESVTLLDCTLRDGSYQFDFQFTVEQTRAIVSALDAAGIKLIEIGHGLGLGAESAGYPPAAATDEEYMRAAAAGTGEAGWGVFFQPAFSSIGRLELGASLGMKFVRIGVEPQNIRLAAAAVLRARELGLLACLNIMKSETVTSERFGTLAATGEQFGAHIVYLVDSSGGMLPGDVRAYVSSARANVGVAVGFHGHDNLGLANANCLAALEAGATYIDTTMRGIGRGGGNAVTEQVAAVLARLQAPAAPRFDLVAEAAHTLIDGVIPASTRLHSELCGYARIHSSLLPDLLSMAAQQRTDPAAFVIAYAARAQSGWNIA